MIVIYYLIIPCLAKCSEIEVNFCFLQSKILHHVFSITITIMWVNHLSLMSVFRNIEKYI